MEILKMRSQGSNSFRLHSSRKTEKKEQHQTTNNKQQTTLSERPSHHNNISASVHVQQHAMC
eukprot:scaffold2924_cov165-Ochromonas_danica.AAC.9